MKITFATCNGTFYTHLMYPSAVLAQKLAFDIYHLNKLLISLCQRKLEIFRFFSMKWKIDQIKTNPDHPLIPPLIYPDTIQSETTVPMPHRNRH